MAWIGLDSKLRDHPKIARLARRIDVPKVEALGLVICLWHWSMTNTQDGDLTRFTAREIADGASYGGKDPEAFVRSLIFTGFLDNTKQGTLMIHEWNEHEGEGQRRETRAQVRGSREYKRFREKVLRRDGYTCQRCGKTGGNLHVHHIKRFVDTPELRLEPRNGITLCDRCHREVHANG